MVTLLVAPKDVRELQVDELHTFSLDDFKDFAGFVVHSVSFLLVASEFKYRARL